jgi:hypothetical protein
MYKRSGDILDYTLDFTEWLNGDTIVSSVFKVDSRSGLVLSQQFYDAQKATVWLSGGARGCHRVVCTITTAQSRTKIYPLLIDVII